MPTVLAQLDDLLATRAEPPVLVGLGEPTHGIEAFPRLRNEILEHVAELGCRSIALEIDFFAASLVDDYVTGTAAEIDTVLANGFSHGFGNVPGNRELVEWLRAHNAGRAPQDRIHFYGFDAPTEYAFAPSPRRALAAILDVLPAKPDLDALLGDEADWTNEAAMHDAAASIGDSDRAEALRVIADQILTHARTAHGLLRYHAAMATPGPERIANLLNVRAEMMADNLLAIVAREQRRGPTLAFAHNAHLQRGETNAGALVARSLGERYVFIATDANPDSKPGTLQHVLAEATDRRTLFPTTALELPPATVAGEPMLPGHIPLTPEDLGRADAVIFVADTDGKRHQYW
jgi:erythromycin esterase-like protein